MWRSPTGEAIYRNVDGIQARSAGTESAARITVNGEMLDWADVIFVMEHHHKKRLLEEYRGLLADKEIVVMDIPDEYRYMNMELISMIGTTVDAWLKK